MKKADLKKGYVLEARGKDVYRLEDDGYMQNTTDMYSWMGLKSYNNNLECEGYPDYNIIKVYDEDKNLLWDRFNDLDDLRKRLVQSREDLEKLQRKEQKLLNEINLISKKIIEINISNNNKQTN